MVLLTALISSIAVISSWTIERSVKGYFALLLLLDTGMMGVFVSLDFFLFYVFWEVMLLPMYFLIGVWGGPRREYAAIKFFLYTLFGSVLMLLAMIALYFSVHVYIDASGATYSVAEALTRGTEGLEKIYTFNMLAMMDPGNYAPDSLLAGFHTTWRYWPTSPCSSASRSRCRSSPSIPGSPTPTWRPRRRSASSSPGSC